MFLELVKKLVLVGRHTTTGTTLMLSLTLAIDVSLDMESDLVRDSVLRRIRRGNGNLALSYLRKYHPKYVPAKRISYPPQTPMEI